MNVPRRVTNRSVLTCLLVASLASTACAQGAAGSKYAQAGEGGKPAASRTAAAGAVLRDLPEKIDPSAKYLFYLHGRIIEVQGVRPRHERHGFYEYEEILRTLAARGFHVISEPRPADTEHVEYARKVVGQINRLLAAGVPARDVTVVGASKGGAIAVFTSTLLKNRDVNFVVLAGCGASGPYRQHKVDLHGRVLSIYDTADEFGGPEGGGVSCAKYYKQSTGLKESRELAIKLGVGHGLLYKPFREWVDPAVEWANGR
ncbi:MAG TPA: hypothetical protein VK421_19470 [Pyrinomonadaceae bacterium]|nr:hypothetical protein [Pyrinomonadaceae bacterium]